MENKINEVASNQETHNQKCQRDLVEFKSQEFQAKNAALEEELLLRQQIQEGVKIVQGILLSQTIDVEGDEEIEQIINASSEAAEFVGNTNASLLERHSQGSGSVSKLQPTGDNKFTSQTITRGCCQTPFRSQSRGPGAQASPKAQP